MQQVNKNKQAGFTLIELMIVVLIIGLLVSFGGWNYIQYARQASIEGAARELRSFLNEAKNNARYGRFSNRPFDDRNNPNPCYVGDLTWTKNALDGSVTDRQFLCNPYSGTCYDTYLEMVGSAGIVLENWAVYFDTRDPTQTTLWMQLYCKKKYKGADVYTYPQVAQIEDVAPLDDRLREKTWNFQPGVKIYKPDHAAAQGADKLATKQGVEFTPLYLSVRYPLNANNKNEVDFGPSCFGERNDEIVIGDVDGKYLYKVRVGVGGDVSKGCFCRGNAEELLKTYDNPCGQAGSNEICNLCREDSDG